MWHVEAISDLIATLVTSPILGMIGVNKGA